MIPSSNSPHNPLPSLFLRRLRLELSFFSFIFPLANRLFKLPTLLWLYRPRPLRNRPELTDPASIFMLIDRRLRRTFFLRRRNCLRRSFLAYHCLCLYGYSPLIHIGLQGDKKALGHSWIELNGKVLCEPGDVHLQFPNIITQLSDIVYRI